jgi:hypothetical protein
MADRWSTPLAESPVPAQVKGLKVLGKTQYTVTLQWAAPPAYNDDIIAYTARAHTMTPPSHT